MRHLLAIIALTLATALSPPAARAAPDWLTQNLRHEDNARDGGVSGRGLSLDQAVSQVRRDTGGRVLSAETVRRDGRSVHRIKILTPENRVRVFYVDAGGRR
jgi:uncharacterized membrane protein YkoI